MKIKWIRTYSFKSILDMFIRKDYPNLFYIFQLLCAEVFPHKYTLAPNKFYHGTNEGAWKAIQEEGVLWGNPNNPEYRYTYLTPDINEARYHGDVLLQIEYQPTEESRDNYAFWIPIFPLGMYCWQFSVFTPIGLDKVKRIQYNG